ncbi:dipeptidase [Chlorella sorokiniana]|uniref:membrane dipeptidase n=1 Tax=Chlorella sorokiniana TaxID=3076 RepID=A0A2P6TXZ8_CHLSO|nr:dipeptidase [Chlorella sorokiniana]|eukprot:PRW58931.1 dipeptidase [Chlorella sorokiniana]
MELPRRFPAGPAAVARLLLVLLMLVARPAAACTSYMVAAGASADGSVIIARNDDGEGAVSPSSLQYHPARQGPAVFRANLNQLELELPGPGLAYLSLPAGPLADPASGRNTSGEAAGVNEAGVAISATESIYNSAAALAADPLNEESGIIEDVIPSVILPQAITARQGAELLGQLVSQHGAGEAFGVLLADSREAWYLETASGHHWMAQRLPHTSFFISANQGRFQEVEEGRDGVLVSPGLRRFAVESGLWDPSSGRPFNFFKAFMRDGAAEANYCYPRVCLLQHMFGGCPAACNARVAPTFMQPAPARITPQAVMAAMRNHWDGTHHDPYTHSNPSEPWRPIALLRTGMGHVTVARPPSDDVPDALSVIMYAAMSTPKLSPFVPVYKSLPGDALPPELATATPEGELDRVSLFWRARRLQALVFQDWRALAPPAADAIVAWERQVERQERPAFEARYAKALRHKGKAAATQLLVEFSHRVAREAGALLDGLVGDTARRLGLPGVPSDDRLLQLLNQAAETYAFEPASDGDDNILRRDKAVWHGKGTAGASLFAPRAAATE